MPRIARLTADCAVETHFGIPCREKSRDFRDSSDQSYWAHLREADSECKSHAREEALNLAPEGKAQDNPDSLATICRVPLPARRVPRNRRLSKSGNCH